MGGKHISLNADFINGNFVDQKTLIHELGHTGGLFHPWEFEKEQSLDNGESGGSSKYQAYDDHTGQDLELAANFMTYSKYAKGSLNGDYNHHYDIKYFNENIGKATLGQIQQIVYNYFIGGLNHDDIPKK